MKQALLRRISLWTALVLFIAVSLLVGGSIIDGGKPDPAQISTVSKAVVTVDDKETDMELPVVLGDLPHGTEVTVSFSVPVQAGDTLFFGSVYAPLTITAGGEKIYEYGKEGTYPKFMTDPPTTYDSVMLPFAGGQEVPVKMVYRSPQERSNLSIHEPVVGTGRNILRMLVSRYGIQMMLAVLIMFVGFVLAVMSAFFVKFPTQGQILLFLGLLCFSSGAWQFGENTFAVFLLERPSLLYVLDFCGLFFLVIPLYKLAMQFLDQPDNYVLRCGMLILEFAAGAAVLLQLTGRVGLHRSLYVFHILLPLAILSVVGVSLYYYFRHHSQGAGLFAMPFAILLVAAIVEVLNYYLRFWPQFSFIFQLGLVLFLMTMAVFSGLYGRNTLTMRFMAMQLQNEVTLQEQAIEAQKVRNELLLSHYEDVRKERHDMRHHLRAVSDLLASGETEKALEYVTSLSASIPAYKPEIYCDNVVVNAALSYYVQAAQEDGVDIKVRVQVPATNRDISDANLCVIFGNLLENATEACRQTEVERFITLSSRVNGEMLFITMDNSSPGGLLQKDGDIYASTKGAGRGQGLRSICSIAERHGGSAQFRAKDGVFQSEVCVRL